MPRPVMIGIVGDSAAGKTTITRGLERVLGEENVTHVCTDDYHKYDRKQRAEMGLTPLHPDCNYTDIMGNHLQDLRNNKAILKPVYRHNDGTFGPPLYVGRAERLTVIEGLLAFHTPEMRDVFDIRIFLDPPEELRRKWKVTRDTSRRGYNTSQVLSELDRREPDSAAFIRPQKQHADLVIAFQPAGGRDQNKLDAEITLQPGLPHPDLSPVTEDKNGIEVRETGEKRVLSVPGELDPGRSQEIQEYLWERLHFARHLRSARLGEFTVGNELVRSEALAVTQILLLYHVLTARATVALGGAGLRDQHAAGATAANTKQKV